MGVTRETWTVKEAAAIIGVGPDTLYRLLASDPENAPPFCRIGSRWRPKIRIPRDGLTQWLHRRK